ncbi:MAG: MMPL family transporter [Candidatus Dormibacteraeota bacterium]|uniref:MMPL family transporter n=1 Tax=Candidatus Amunia macphersoniae TaxID=3127014 RepID=A0A934NFC0_9BACT|nr:MMPL family transporter [Candidatus Dormibacteraeota bacterium]
MYARRRLVMVLSLVAFMLSIVAIARGGEPKNANSFDFESGRGFALMSSQLPANAISFTLILSDPGLASDDQRFRQEVSRALAPLAADHRVNAIQTAYTAPLALAAQMVSADGHRILAVVSLNLDFTAARQQFGGMRDQIQPPPQLSVAATGDVPLAYEFDSLLAADLEKAEIGSSLVALVLLVIVFGTGVAALICLAVGLLAVTGGVGAALLLAHVTDVSTYALNIVTLIGLGIAIDYSLFIVSRFREELGNGANVDDAVAVAMGTAGRAILFSGLTVAIGLSAMLFYRGTFLVSMGICGAIVVAVSVLLALTFLPALLSILGRRVNRLAVPILRPRPHGQGSWHRIAVAVMRRPVVVLLPTILVLLAAGSPFLHIQLANTDVTQLPPDAEARQGAELLATAFPSQGANIIQVVVEFSNESPLSAANVDAAHSLSQRLHRVSGVASVRSYVDVTPGLSSAGYQSLYAGSRASLPPAARDQVTHSTGHSIAVLDAVTPFLPASQAAHDLVRTIRAQAPTDGARVMVTGDTAFDIDFVGYIVRPDAARCRLRHGDHRLRALPAAALADPAHQGGADEPAVTQRRIRGDGVDLPGRSSLRPAQHHQGAIDPTLPVLLFCVVFGLSMDYEVFLLTRMQEAWRQTHDNRTAVADGLERSGRLITGAAAIMISVFIAFGLARVVTIKATGIGMAVAVLADATLVRALVVPALMRLLGRANWWAPRWLGGRPAEPQRHAPAT